MIITGAQEPSRIPTSPQLLNPIDLLVQAVSVRDRIQVKDGEGLVNLFLPMEFSNTVSYCLRQKGIMIS